jgi:hypothetical protein
VRWRAQPTLGRRASVATLLTWPSSPPTCSTWPGRTIWWRMLFLGLL